MAGAAYAAALLLLTLGPLGWWLNRLTVRIYVVVRYDLGLTAVPLEPEHVGIALNVVLYIPVGALLVVVLRGRSVLAAALALTLSLGIEAIQLLPALERRADWVDVVANGLGGVLGARIGAWVHRREVRPQ